MGNAGRVSVSAILFALAALEGCSLSYRDSPPYTGPYSRSRPEPRFERRGITKLDTGALPPTGAYYAYAFERDQTAVNNPEGMLSDMYARGIDVTDAWYHGPKRCGPPGEYADTDTRYGPEFLIHLSRADDGMGRFKFRPILDPRQFLCPYSLVLFTIAADTADTAASTAAPR